MKYTGIKNVNSVPAVSIVKILAMDFWNNCHEDVGGTQNGSVLWMVARGMGDLKL